MQIEKFIKIGAARLETYRLIADFYLPPKAGYLEQVVELEERLQLVCPDAVAYLPEMQHEIDLMELKVDHARLFVGPFKVLAPPFGSVYMESKRELMGASSLDARKRYQEAGLDLSTDHKEAPDHIATELEFMHFLIFRELESIAKDDFEQAHALAQSQKDFLEKHLGRWTPAFTALVEEHATAGFFKGLARISREFVQQDRQFLSETNLAQLAELAMQSQELAGADAASARSRRESQNPDLGY